MGMDQHTIVPSMSWHPYLHPKYSWDDRVLRRKGKTIVRDSDTLRRDLFQYFRGRAIGGHSCVETTRYRMVGLFY